MTRRNRGNDTGPISATAPRNHYIVYWKDAAQPEKATVWFWRSPELVSLAEPCIGAGAPFGSHGSLVNPRKTMAPPRQADGRRAPPPP